MDIVIKHFFYFLDLDTEGSRTRFIVCRSFSNPCGHPGVLKINMAKIRLLIKMIFVANLIPDQVGPEPWIASGQHYYQPLQVERPTLVQGWKKGS